MSVRAGDIRQFTVGGREFDPAAESNWTIRLGGFNNEVALTGNGVAHVTQRRQTAGIADAEVSADPSRQDLEYLQDIKDSGETVPVNMTLVDGTTYSGSLYIVGELEHNTGEGTVSMELRGSKFEQI
jgi:hypothetical protein